MCNLAKTGWRNGCYSNRITSSFPIYSFLFFKCVKTTLAVVSTTSSFLLLVVCSHLLLVFRTLNSARGIPAHVAICARGNMSMWKLVYVTRCDLETRHTANWNLCTLHSAHLAIRTGGIQRTGQSVRVEFRALCNLGTLNSAHLAIQPGGIRRT
jgi:hypothetical protein